MSRYGEGVCIDCGTTGERLLAPRFPHICEACLFPAQTLDTALVHQIRRRSNKASRAPYITGRWV